MIFAFGDSDSDDFITQYLLDCLQTRRGHLATHVQVVTDFIDLENERNNNKYWTCDNWADLFEVLYNKAVDSENTVALREALSAAHDCSPPKIKNPRENSTALVKACLVNNICLVKLMVCRGYFLRARLYRPDPIGRSLWTDLPSFTKKARETTDDKFDEVQSLHVLRALSRPCYVLSCYTVVTTAKKFKFLRVADSECKCCKIGITTTFRDFSNSIVNYHFCPNNDNYLPEECCNIHPECNDPVYRCFDMASITARYAKDFPAYREEYLEVSGSFNQLAVELLEECKNAKEVEMFLKDPIGSKKFFTKGAAKRLLYPRLQMALVNEHHAFAGHMFCQNILKKQWLGNVNMNQKSVLFKLLYVFIECLLVAPFCFHYMLGKLLRGIGVTDKRWEKSGLPVEMYRFVCGPFNLDDPINRFIASSFCHLIYFLLIITSIIMPLIEQSVTNNFHWYHTLLGVFTLSFLIKDYTVMSSTRDLTLKSTSATVHFWHVYDIFAHVIMFSALFTRFLMGKLHPWEECSEDLIKLRLPFDIASNCLFSISLAMTGVRLLYWFQLHDRLGPIVINFSRVLYDIMTFTLVYLTVMTSFALSLVPLVMFKEPTFNQTQGNETNELVYSQTSSQPLFNQTGGNESMLNQTGGNSCQISPFSTAADSTIHSFFTTLGDQVQTLFWLTLNPEDPETFKNSNSQIKIMGNILIVSYAIYSVIVFLNLLIATMNSTIQKVSDKRHLYWKFVRTGIWVDFFGEESALPPPFNLITGFVIFVTFVVKKIVKQCCPPSQLLPVMANTNEKGNVLQSDDVSLPAFTNFAAATKLRNIRRQRRQQQSKLTLSLIERYWNTASSRLEAAESTYQKQGHAASSMSTTTWPLVRRMPRSTSYSSLQFASS